MRETKWFSFRKIAGKVWNLQRTRPSPEHVRLNYKSSKKAQPAKRVLKYHKCGRKAYKLPADAVGWLVNRMLALRRTVICTSSILQRDIAKEKGIVVSQRQIRRKLNEKGYHWLPRHKKPKLSKARMAERARFCKDVVAMTEDELEQHIALSMDGLVLAAPPEDALARQNHCHYDDNCVYRKKGEIEPLTGHDDYVQQIPEARVVPLWGGIAKGGFVAITFHKSRKLNQGEWCKLVRNGTVSTAVRRLWPKSRRGPWKLLCDNEKFLNAKLSRAEHLRRNISLWQIPAKSPDLNPVERYWSWLRRRLRDMDLDDLVKGKPPATKAQYKARIRGITQTEKSKTVARNLIRGLRKICQTVADGGGARHPNA